MQDPALWFPVNATLDGLDTGSDNLLEQVKYLVYQRRLTADALKTRAMLHAMLGDGDNASKAAKEYFSMAFPVSPEIVAALEAKKAAKMEAIVNMTPLKFHNGKLTPSARA
jgi:hypothetical protein